MSGRSRWRGMPVIRSTSGSRSAGTQVHKDIAARDMPNSAAIRIIKPRLARIKIMPFMFHVKHAWTITSSVTKRFVQCLYPFSVIRPDYGG